MRKWNNKINHRHSFRRVISIKDNGKLSEFPEAMALIKNYLGHYFFYYTNDIAKLNKSVHLPFNDKSKQLAWVSNLINAYSLNLNEYIKLKREYSNLILRGEYEEGQLVLDQIKDACGWSIWLIEAKFFCAQRLNGLEGNKKLLEEIYELRDVGEDFDSVYFISFLISERNEDGCDISLLYKKWFAAIDNISDQKSKEYISDIIKYFIFNEIDKSVDPIRIYNNCSRFSVYDSYELTLRMLIEHDALYTSKEKSLSLRILAKINDVRLFRLSASYGFKSYCDKFQPEDFIEENYSIYPLIFNVSIKMGFELNGLKGYLSQFFEALTQIVNAGKGINDALGFVSQFSVNFKHIDEIYELMSVPSIFLNVSEIEMVNKLADYYGNKIPLEFVDNFAIENIGEKNFKKKITILEKFKKWNFNYVDDALIQEYEEDCIRGYIHSHLCVLMFYSYMESGNIPKAFEYFSEKYLLNTNISKLFKLGYWIEGKSWPYYKKIKTYVNSAIIIKAYLKDKYDEKQIFNLKACWRSFMNEVNIRKPSELQLNHFDGNFNLFVFYLKEICTSDILESDAVNFNDTRDIKIERILICEKLLALTNDHQLLMEKEILERDLAISDGLNEVETAGLIVDEVRFKSVAKIKFKNEYERYKSFLELEKGWKSSIAIEERTSHESSLITKPVDEGDSILLKLIHDMGEMFLKNQEFGLDYYLSMRVRHGRLIGVARGPLERRKLITKFSEDENKYLDNKFWLDKYRDHLSFEELKKLNITLCEFSEWFDSEIEYFRTNQVQVQSDEKPLGMFTITYTRSGLQLIKDTISNDLEIENFIDFIIDYFIHNIYRSSVVVKKWINYELKRRVNQRFFSLQSEVNNIIDRQGVDKSIVSEITSARTEMYRVLDDIATWFDISSDSKKAIRTYTLENIIDISLSRTNRVYQSFSPSLKLDIKIEDLVFHGELLAIMVDALSIVFSNAIIHGKTDSPKLTIGAEIIESNEEHTRLKISIKNPADECLIDLEKIENIRNDIKAKKLKTRHEGGSGFHKLAALSIIKNHEDLCFGYSNNEFYVDLIFTLEIL
ncbi:hypothetical protein ACJCFQ_003517 [Enterobacter hormaechei]